MKLFSKIRKKKSTVHIENEIIYIPLEDSDVCAICLSDFEINCAIYITKCNHVYHRKCIEMWCKKKCICALCKSCI